jgi:hypothetical protein
VSASRPAARRRLWAVAATVLLLAALAVADPSLALELAPGAVLVALASLGWMPGEARLVRAMRRRRPAPWRRRAAALVRRGPRVLRALGRRSASSIAVRGPPLPVTA